MAVNSSFAEASGMDPRAAIGATIPGAGTTGMSVDSSTFGTLVGVVIGALIDSLGWAGCFNRAGGSVESIGFRIDANGVRTLAGNGSLGVGITMCCDDEP